MAMTQPSETQELKPCPFCGGIPSYDERSEMHYVRCETCAMIGDIDVSVLTSYKSKSYRLWNTRAPVDSQGAGDDTRSLLRKLKDFLFDNCDHADRDRNYDWCPKCVMAFVEVLARPSDTNAATQMRTACVEKVKEMRRAWDEAEKSLPVANGFTDKANAADEIVTALESLTPDQVKQK